METLISIDFTYLLAFEIGYFHDVAVLSFALAFVEIGVSQSRGICHRSHRNRFGKSCCQTGNQDDLRVTGGCGNTQDNPQYVDQSILTSQDHIGKRRSASMRVFMGVVVMFLELIMPPSMDIIQGHYELSSQTLKNSSFLLIEQIH